jgi:hypothetical protein
MAMRAVAQVAGHTLFQAGHARGGDADHGQHHQEDQTGDQRGALLPVKVSDRNELHVFRAGN